MTRRQPSRKTEPIRESSLDDTSEPTAADPWTATLILDWTPDQNYSRVSVMPQRSPVHAIWGQLTAGEELDAVAVDYQISVSEARVLEQLRLEVRDDLAEVTRERDQLHRALKGLVEAADTAVIEQHRHHLMDPAWDQAQQVLAEQDGPAYPGTRFLTMCVLEGRKSGRVTVGESRLPVEMVLGTVRECGVDEAAACWPQLHPDELAVAAQLVADLDAGDLPERADLLAELPHDDHCQAYGVHAECCPGRDCGCTTSETLDKLVELGWLRFASEPGDGDG